VVTLSFLLVIPLGYWVATHIALRGGLTMDWTLGLFYGTTLVLWYFLFVYLLPWAWPVFVVFASGTVTLYIDRMKNE